jgi:predicted dehydrogenase
MELISMNSKRLRYGIVGAGSIADKKHLKLYSESDDVELLAICDENGERAKVLADKYKIQNVYTDYIKMLDEIPLDFISVCVPNYLHEPVTVKALEKGVHVYCEKPAALNAGAVRNMVNAKNKSGKKLMIGLNNRFTNSAFFLKNYIEQGNLGDVYHIKCGWRRRREIPGKGSWFTDKSLSGGGPLIDLGVHMIDLAMYLTDNWQPVSVSSEVYSKFSENTCRNNRAYGFAGDGIYNVEDMSVGFIRFSNGCTISFEFSWASNIEKEYKYYELLGDKGGAFFAEDKLKLYSEIGDTLVDIYPNTNYSHDAMNELKHFIDCIKSDSMPISTPEQAVKVMSIIDAAYASSKMKKEIYI